MRFIRLLAFVTVVLSALLAAPQAFSYPEFIGYGYKTCTGCHYNNTGGGQLTDYGRSVFAAEIAAKPFWNLSADDEKLAECSNFLGCMKSPTWLKPGIKTRRLIQKTNPGAASSVQRDYKMQADLNISSFTSAEEKLGIVATLAWVEDPIFASPNKTVGGSELMMREYFLRWQMTETLWWSLGFMDKAYGIKHPDHTAVNRAPVNMGQNDQTHALQMYWQKGDHMLVVQPFFGNMHLDDSRLRSKGGALTYEYGFGERAVIGGSLKTESSNSTSHTMVALINKYGLDGGHALLNEFGGREEKPQSSPTKTGFYDYFLMNIHLTRGLNFQSIFQYSKLDGRSEAPETFQWGLGFLYFPFQRVELRAQAIQSRTQSTTNVREDSWALQGQLHLSL